MTERLPHYFFFILFAAVAVLTFFVLKPFLSVLALAAIFAVVLTPLQRRLTPVLGGHVWLASLFLVILLVVIILGLLAFFGIRVSTELQSVDLSFNWLHARLIDLHPRLGGDLPTYINRAVGWLVNHVGTIFSGTASILLKTVLWFIALFFLLKDGHYFKKLFMTLSPLADKYDKQIVDRLASTIHAVVTGALLIALIQGVLSGIGMSIFGVPKPVLFGTVAAVSALIPGIGTALVMIPSVIYLFAVGATGAAVGLLIWSVVAVGLVDNVLAPFLYSRGGRVHPLLMLLSVLGGLIFFGPAGFILGPVCVSLFSVLIDIYREQFVTA